MAQTFAGATNAAFDVFDTSLNVGFGMAQAGLGVARDFSDVMGEVMADVAGTAESQAIAFQGVLGDGLGLGVLGGFNGKGDGGDYVGEDANEGKVR